MKVVIDSNRAQSDELAKFLAAARSNRAVVTDWFMMEAYKGETRASIYKSLGVLSRFPRQVIVLKNTGMCMQTRVGPQMADRLIWRKHTTRFPQFIAEVESAKQGNLFIEEGLQWRGTLASERMQTLTDQSRDIIGQHEMALKGLTKEDIAIIRGKVLPVHEGTIARIVSIAVSIAEAYRQQAEARPENHEGKKYLGSFLFRVGLAQTCSFLEWVRTGGQINMRPEKVRNDYIDAMISVYGTYFNGLMTADKRLALVHSVSRELLRILGAKLLPAYRSPERKPITSR
jgi:hypothetical protein